MIDQISDKIKKLANTDKKIAITVMIAVVCLILLLSINVDSEDNIQHNQETTTVKNNFTTTDIQTELEKQLENIIGNINGVGAVEVMITLGSSGEYVYAENSKTEDNGDKSSFDSEIVLYESENGNDEGLLVSIKNPEILGVAVVCDGGGSAIIRSEITNLVTSLFGIGVDRVYVGSNAA